MAKRRGEEFWREHLGAWHRSDLTQVAYCASQSLSLKSFYRWRRKEKEGSVAALSALTLVPVRVSMSAPAEPIRLHSPGGWRIELTGGSAPSPWLADLLRQLP
jgi:hypothetical protein